MTDNWDPPDCQIEHTPAFDRIIRTRTIGVPQPYSGAVIRAAHEAYRLAAAPSSKPVALHDPQEPADG